MRPIEGTEKKMLYYHEIFSSIQGEGTDTGKPCVFVRLYGCNLKCSYCDQPQKPSDRRRISVENMLVKIKEFRIPYVCITGGEPLIQPEIFSVIYGLVDLGIEVSIETNGNVEIDEDNYLRSYKYIMDMKCPSSGESHRNNYVNLTRLFGKDEIKFVIADREDYEFAKNIIKKYPNRAVKLFSPMFDTELNQTIGKDLCDWLVEDRIVNARITIQTHKILGVL